MSWAPTKAEKTDDQLFSEAESLLIEIRDELGALQQALGQLARLASETTIGMEAADQLRLLEGYHPRGPNESINLDKLEGGLTWLREELRGRKLVAVTVRLLKAVDR